MHGDQVTAPECEPTGSSTVKCTWDPPGVQSGLAVQYRVYFVSKVDGTKLMYVGAATEAVIGKLEPFTEYQVRLAACNKAGCTAADEVSTTTLQAAPEGVKAPSVKSLGTDSFAVSWGPPSKPNGKVSGYTLFVLGKSTLAFNTNGNTFALNVTGDAITAYSTWRFQLRACTIPPKCSTSSAVEQTSDPAAPAGQAAPSIALINSEGENHTVQITWDPPSQPNGELIRYEVDVGEHCDDDRRHRRAELGVAHGVAP